MFVYILLLSLSIIGWYCIENDYIHNKFMLKYSKKRLEDYYLKIMFGLMFILSAFRSYSVGTDTKNYLSHYYDVCSNGLEAIQRINFETGYEILMYVTSFLNNPRVLFCILSAIICFGYYRLIKKYSTNVFFSTFLFISLYIYALTFNIVRQFIAIIFIIEFVMELNKGEWRKSIVWLFIASLFHKTALIMVIFYPFMCLKKLVKNPKEFERILIILLGISVFAIDLGLKMISIIIPKYQYYLDDDKHISEMISNEFLFSFSIVLILIVLIIDYFIKSRNRYYEIAKLVFIFGILYFNLFFVIENNRLIGLLCTTILLYDNVINKKEEKNIFYYLNLLTIYTIFLQAKVFILSRLIWYFFIFIIFYVPSRVENKKIITSGVCAFCILYYIKLLLQNIAEIVPYSFGFF